MSIFAFIGCRLNRHKPVRRDVAWNGRTYVGQCRHCGAAIERHGRNNWRKRSADRQGTTGAPTRS